MRHKFEALSKFKEWKVEVETQIGRKVRHLRFNNGREYKSKEFENFYKAKGVIRYFTISYTPQQNLIAKTISRTLSQ